MTERDACALLKARFEAAGYHIAENQPFAAAGVSFELDGWDAGARVGYEYVTEEAGDGWDVDADVIAKLDAGRAAGDLHVLVVDEKDAPDAGTLEAVAGRFLAELTRPAAKTRKPAARKPASVPKARPKPNANAKAKANAKPAARAKAADKKTSARKTASRARSGK